MDHVPIVKTSYGKPYGERGFGKLLADAIDAAGLPEGCVAHGLRKAAGRRLAEALCTPHEIMSILGHKSLKQAELYTKEANRIHLAQSGMEKLEARTSAPNPLQKFGNSRRK
jgi:integrase